MMMVDQSTWSGTAAELDVILCDVPANLENGQGWPAEPRIRLRTRAPSLSEVGVIVTSHKVGHERKRVITLTKEADQPDPPIEDTSLAPTAVAEREAVPDGEGDREITDSVRNVRNTDFTTTTRVDAADGADQAETGVQTDGAGDAEGADRRAGNKSIIFDRAIQQGDRIIPIYKVRKWGVAMRRPSAHRRETLSASAFRRAMRPIPN
jgi:hypothetical protein